MPLSNFSRRPSSCAPSSFLVLFRMPSFHFVGPGGGGCALTILGAELGDRKESLVKDLTEGEGFRCYESSLGGPGILYHNDGALPPASQLAAAAAKGKGGGEGTRDADNTPQHSTTRGAGIDDRTGRGRRRSVWGLLGGIFQGRSGEGAEAGAVRGFSVRVVVAVVAVAAAAGVVGMAIERRSSRTSRLSLSSSSSSSSPWPRRYHY